MMRLSLAQVSSRIMPRKAGSSGFFPAHGFLDVGGMFTVTDDPNATSGTTATDINRSDQIVGSYNFTDRNDRVDRAGSLHNVINGPLLSMGGKVFGRRGAIEVKTHD